MSVEQLPDGTYLIRGEIFRDMTHFWNSVLNIELMQHTKNLQELK